MVATIQIADQVETTMKEAKLAALSELSTPALFLAETQVGGHGRFNRPFFSPKGKGIYMRLIAEAKPYLQRVASIHIIGSGSCGTSNR